MDNTLTEVRSNLFVVGSDGSLMDVSEVNLGVAGERVQFGAKVSGNEGKPLAYTFYCGNVTYDTHEGTLIDDISGSDFLCEYQMPGVYTAKLGVDTSSGELTDAVTVYVGGSAISLSDDNVMGVVGLSWTFPFTVAITLLAVAIYAVGKSIHKGHVNKI